MIDCLVFSRDRPMQLDACLRSLAENAPQVRRPVVIYRGTSHAYREGYRIVRDEHVAALNEETSFARQVIDFLALAHPFVLLLCDDAVTYRPLPDGSLEDAMADDVLGLNLRLGTNTTYCYPLDSAQPIPDGMTRGQHWVWEWQDAAGDFGYPYSTDGTVHRRDSLLEWLAGASFTNPNTMEDTIVAAVGRRQGVPQLTAAYPESVQVGLPFNVVNETHPNRCGKRYGTADLNERFLSGERIDYTAMDYHSVCGGHQEIDLVFAAARELARV